MNATDVVRRLHQHRRWANEKLLDAARSLTTDQLHRTFAIGQGSVWRTLVHLLAAEYVWLEALLGDSRPVLPGDLPEQLPGNQQGEATIESMDELTRRWHELDRRWDAYLAGLEEESLGQAVEKISTSSGPGKVHRTSRLDVLLHVCTHAQYTTAQLVNMLRQLDQPSLPDGMLITLARREAASAGSDFFKLPD